MTGVVIETKNNLGMNQIVMRGDDGKKYEHHISHFQLLENEDTNYIQHKLAEKEAEKLNEIESRKNSLNLYIGDRVLESDSSVLGYITAFDNKRSFPHAIMKGDDGRIYNKNLSHYRKIKSEEDEAMIKQIHGIKE